MGWFNFFADVTMCAGTAVYLSTVQSSASGQYQVSVDDSTPIKVDNFKSSTNATCGVSWGTSGLPNGQHNASMICLVKIAYFPTFGLHRSLSYLWDHQRIQRQMPHRLSWTV